MRTAKLRRTTGETDVAVVLDLDGTGTNMGGWYGEDIGHVNSKWQAERGFGPFNTAAST